MSDKAGSYENIAPPSDSAFPSKHTLASCAKKMNALSPMLVTPVPMVALIKPLCWNAETPILVTLLGIVTLVRLEQLKKAIAPMLVRRFPSAILVRLVQPLKAPPSMLVTLSGIVMLVSMVQPENAPQLMVVTVVGIVTLVGLAVAKIPIQSQQGHPRVVTGRLLIVDGIAREPPDPE